MAGEVDPRAGAGSLLGRDTELATLGAFLAAAGSGARSSVVIRGAAGYGKTALLDQVVSAARRQGWRCLVVRGIESESALAGAGLLAAVTSLRAYLESVPPAQADALRAAVGWGTTTSPGEQFLVGAATLSLLSAAAVDGPVLVAVDDVQWVDPDSAQALLFAARRLAHDPVAVVLTQRTGLPLRVPLDGFDVVTVGGLPVAAAQGLLGPGFSDRVVDRLVDRTDGNPLALIECRRALTRAERAGAAPLPHLLPVPARLQDVYAAELAGLSPSAWRLAVLAAAATDQAAAPVLAALTAEGHDPDICLVEAAGVVELRDGALGFRHPLVRSATWDRASVAERRSAHQSLADVVADGAARAWHRAEAACGHDDEVAAELEAAADRDRSRRGFGAASTAMERSARLTTDSGLRIQRLAAATEDAYVAGDTATVRRLADEVLDAETADDVDADSDARARVLVAWGKLEQHYGTMVASRRRFERAADLATGRLRARALCELALTCHFLDDRLGALAAADRLAAVADRADPEQAMLAAFLSGAALTLQGRRDLGTPLIQDAVDRLESDPSLRADPRHLTIALLSVYWLTEPAGAVAAAETRLASARERGALGVLALGLSAYSGVLAWAGEHVRGYAVAGEAIELLDTLGYAADPGVACEVAAVACAGRGMHAEAQRLLGRARQFTATHDVGPMPPHLAGAVAACALSRGDLAEVVRVLEDQVARFGGVGVLMEPLGVAPLLVEAYLALGRDEDARELAARYTAAQADPAHPYIAAMVARCQGLVARDLDEAVSAFERCVAIQAQQPDGYETARSRLLYGMRLRRGGRRVDARQQLEAARAAFLVLDLTSWAERATQELAGTGGRARSRDSTREPLTSQETRVALLVAQGLTNREVAAELFLSPKTVEHHVGAVLRKRGLRSRTELARALTVEALETAEAGADDPG